MKQAEKKVVKREKKKVADPQNKSKRDSLEKETLSHKKRFENLLDDSLLGSKKA